jgi:hypothetical protein
LPDFIAAVSGIFVAMSAAWILAALFFALGLGSLAGALFLTIFYSASRLAAAAERASDKKQGAGRKPTPQKFHQIRGEHG